MHDALTIGIPTFAVLLGILLNRGDGSNLRADLHRTLDEMSRRFDARFDEMDRRFKEVDRRFDNVDRRVEGVEKRLDGIDARLDRIDGDLKHFHNVTGKMEGRIEELSRR